MMLDINKEKTLQQSQEFTPGQYDVSDKLVHQALKLSVDASYGHHMGETVFMAGGEGAILQDMDENQYVDFVLGGGSQVHGHGFKPVLDALQHTTALGVSLGAPVDKATYLCDLIQERHPAVDKVLLLPAVAQGWQILSDVLTVADQVILSVGSRLPHTKAIAFNDIKALKKAYVDYPVAGVVVSSWCEHGNLLNDAYLTELRALCDASHAWLIADERESGLRMAKGSAQDSWCIKPDVTLFGDSIGGGLPLAALAGKADIMTKCVAAYQPLDAVSPLSVAAGCAHVEHLTTEFYASLEQQSNDFEKLLADILGEEGVIRHGSCFWLTGTLPVKWHQALRDAGVFWPESGPAFFSAAHTDALLAHTQQVFKNVFCANAT